MSLINDRVNQNLESSEIKLETMGGVAGISERLQALVSASVAISSELDLDLVLQNIADTAREFARAHYAAIGIVNDQGIITSFITSGISKEQREKIGEPPRGHGLLGVLIKQGKSLRVRDMSKDERRSGFPPNHPPMTSLLGVPVSIKDQIVGDLYLTDKIDCDEFSAEDEWWLTLFARHAAVAVQNGNLYKKLRVAHQRAQTLAEMAGALNRSVNVEDIFQQITEAACRLLELPASALYLFERREKRFVLQSHVGLDVSPPLEQNFLPLEGSIAGQVLIQNLPMVVPNTAVLEETYFLPLEGGKKANALMVIPIRQNKRVSGVIEVYSPGSREFSLEEISLLEAFAGQASLALEKAQIYRQKEEFLSMIAHDLRAPLTAIKMSTGLLETSLPPDVPPALNRLVANIGRNSERLNTMLNDLLELTRLEQGRINIQPDPLEISRTITSTAHTLLPLFEGKQQELKVEPLSEEHWIMADRRRLDQALVNLLTNANKYTPNGSKVQITLPLTENSVTIRITDNGPGIPAEDQLHIFDRYYRRAIHDQTDETFGSGLGLPIARHLVELQGGQLWVESEVGQGSTFCIKLPLYFPELSQ